MGLQRFTRRYPCLICGGGNDDPRGQHKRCTGFLSENGRSAYCSREEFAGALALNTKTDPPAYLHKMRGDCECGQQHNPADIFVRPITDIYNYENPDGTVRYQVCRTWPKDFFQRRPNDHGGFVNNMRGVERIPYQLPKLLADPGKGVLIVEGEKSVQALLAAGFLATCVSGGAGVLGSAKKGWTPATAHWLRGRGVVIIPDNDEPGREGAAQAAQVLSAAGAHVRILTLVPSEDHDGADDWLEAGHSADELRQLILSAPKYEASGGTLAAPIESNGHKVIQFPGGNGHGTVPPDVAGTGGGDPDYRFLYTDTRNALRLVERHRDDLRFDFDRSLWRRYREGVWALDDQEEVMLLAKTAVSAMHDEIRVIFDPEKRAKALRAVLAVEATSRLRAMCANAQSELPGGHDLWDQHPWLLNCLNGTVDLQTGELRPHRPEDWLTKVTATPYEADAACPGWMAFLRQIFAGDESMIGFLQRALGLALVGKMLERKLFVFWGHGSNGKTITLETVQGVLGEYAKPTAHDFLSHHDSPQHLEGIAALRGVRFVTTVETDEGARLSEALVKMLTGGDRRTARYLFENSFSYEPSDTFFLATNHKPVIRDSSNGMWDRVRLLPFAVTIAPPPGMVGRLLAERSGILAWMVRGCLEYQASGLGSAAAIDAATADYRSEMDVLAAFFEDTCILGPDFWSSSEDLYQAFAAWAGKTHEQVWSSRRLGVRLKEYPGLEQDRSAHARGWRGVGVKGSNHQAAMIPPI